MNDKRFLTETHRGREMPTARRCMLPPRWRIAIFFGLVALGGLWVHADRYVDKHNHSPEYPHDSWDNAAVHIQEAVDAAAENDTVWIRAGTYTLPPNATNYYGTNVVYINKPLTLRSETDNHDDVIIDGEGEFRPIAAVYTSGATSTDEIAIRGLTVTNGYGISRGGGILFYHRRAAWRAWVINCLVTDNTAVWGEKQEEGDVTHLNDGAYGGGICSYAYAESARLFVSNAIVRNNQADPLNAASRGGGIYARTDQTKHLFNTRIENNEAFNGGGAFLERGGAHVLIENNIFAHNTAKSTTASGGGGGGAYLHSSDGLVRNSLFYGNSSENFGGGINTHHQNSTMNIVNCTIVHNTAPGGRGGGIGVRFANTSTGSGINLYNSIVYHNTAENIYYEIGLGTHADAVSHSAFTNNITTVLQDSQPFPGTGTITAAPTYVDTDARNYRLVRDSRGVNEGFNLEPELMGATDLEGNRRIDGVTGRVDIGAYEYVYGGTILMVR